MIKFNKLTIFKDVSSIVVVTLIAQLITFLLQPVLKKYYSPEEFGAYDIYFKIVIILGTFITLKYEKAIVLCKDRQNSIKLLIIVVSIAFFFTIIMESFFLLRLNWIIEIIGFPAKYKYWLLLSPVSAFFLASTISISFFLIREKKFSESASLKISRRIPEGIAQSALGITRIMNGLVIGELLGNIASFTYGIIRLTKHGFKFAFLSKRIVFYNLKKYSAFPKYALLSNMLNTFVMSALTFQVFAKFTLKDVGYMELTQKILTIPTAFIGMAVGQVILQRFSAAYIQKSSILKDFIIFSFINIIVALGFGLVIWFWAENIFLLIFGENWLQSAVYAKMIIFSTGVLFISSSLGQTLIGLNKIRLNAFWEYFKFLAIISLFFINFQDVNEYLFVYNYIIIFVYLLYYIVIIIEVLKFERINQGKITLHNILKF